MNCLEVQAEGSFGEKIQHRLFGRFADVNLELALKRTFLSKIGTHFLQGLNGSASHTIEVL